MQAVAAVVAWGDVHQAVEGVVLRSEEHVCAVHRDAVVHAKEITHVSRVLEIACVG